jgi:hypothetical protein
MVRGQMQDHLRPLPDYLALSGTVVEGTASHPADVLELIVVPSATAPVDWEDDVAALVTQLSRDLGNVVVRRSAQDLQEAEAMGGSSAVRVLPV